MKLQGRHALVVGLGKSGAAAARLLLARGASVAGADDKEVDAGLEVRRVVPEALRGIDLVVASPGVPLSLPLFAEARAKGIELIGEVELASRFIEEPIIGVTGTNGKSTTTALTGHLIASAGKRVFVGGNLGNALSNHVLSGERVDAVVCELSSFQLESIVSLRCAAATVLNVTPDHLDRYASLEAYAAAKARIFENQRAGDSAVVNLADGRANQRTHEGVVRFRFDPRWPSTGGELGKSEAWRTGPRGLFAMGKTYELRAPTLRGDHNAENALAACLLARLFAGEGEVLQRGLDTYPGLPHRLEPVRMLDGVEYVNDSKATNVDSVEKSLSAFERGVHLIAGGRGKGAPYAPLRGLLPGRVKSLLLIGEDAEKIAAELGDLAEVHRCGALQQAVAAGRKLARAGDVVLLSPACASYDQFRNFEDRGEQFKALVRGLA